MSGSFALRVKIGEYEVEISGTREEVMKTIEELPGLMTNVRKAIDIAKPKTIATLTVKTDHAKQQGRAEKHPVIIPTEKHDEAVMRVLETDWGKWRPRTIDELGEALRTNGLDCSTRTLAGVLAGIVKKGKIRRWNTDSGMVYILAEGESKRLGGEAE